MSRGSNIVPVRISHETLAMVDRIICELNRRTKGTPYDRSSFIRKAIKDHVKHIWRSRKQAPALFDVADDLGEGT
jgi:hypothetical protein